MLRAFNATNSCQKERAELCGVLGQLRTPGEPEHYCRRMSHSAAVQELVVVPIMQGIADPNDTGF